MKDSYDLMLLNESRQESFSNSQGICLNQSNDWQTELVVDLDFIELQILSFHQPEMKAQLLTCFVLFLRLMKLKLH